MKRLLLLVFLLIVRLLDSYATMQAPDIHIWNEDTLYLDKSPLEELSEVCKKIREEETFDSSSCWNGFITEWIIIDDTLFLKNIFNSSGKKSTADLKNF